MLDFAKSLLVIIFLVGVIIYVTFFSTTIKNLLTSKSIINGKSVLGISVSSPSATTNLFKQQANSSLKNLTKQISQIKLGDIVKSINNGGKMIHDLSGWEKTIQTDIQQISGQKK